MTNVVANPSALGGDEDSPLAAVLLRTESASSSQIEQITAGARRWRWLHWANPGVERGAGGGERRCYAEGSRAVEPVQP